MPVTLYLAIPCYNEEEVLPETAKRLREKFSALRKTGTISAESRACFIDDGSKDKTWSLICELHQKDPMFSGIKLSRNRGHQNALLCGLMTLRERADCVISLDADLQDDINAIDGMLEKFQDGCDIVYGVRSKRKTDTAFKRMTAQGFYRVMKALGADVVFNHADYRLMSRRALDALADYKEVNLFLRGMVPLVGYRSDIVYYERAERFAGESKYPLKKMLSFAWGGHFFSVSKADQTDYPAGNFDVWNQHSDDDLVPDSAFYGTHNHWMVQFGCFFMGNWRFTTFGYRYCW